MATMTFELDDDLLVRVQRIEAAFSSASLPLTRNASLLLALAVQSQQDEKSIPSDALRKRLDKFDALGVIGYCKSTYVGKRVGFNRAFHLINDSSPLVKFPWTPSPE